MITTTPFLALLLSALATPQESSADGFDAPAGDPFSAGLFQELPVEGAGAMRVLAQEVHGTTAHGPFVNVLRWADARPYRGRLFQLLHAQCN